MNKGLLVLALIGPICIGQGKGYSARLDSFDLDSLAYMSSAIVEGNLQEHCRDEKTDYASVQVTAVYKGTVKVGQTLTIAALDSFYRKAARAFHGTIPLDLGDKLILFLAKRPCSIWLHGVPEDSHMYGAVPSGAKLILDDKVFGFSQYRGTLQPYVAEDDRVHFRSRPFPSVAEFEEQLRKSLEKTDALAGQFNRPPSASDSPWLMQLLRERAQDFKSRASWHWGDYLAELACRRLASLHDHVALSEAMLLDLPFQCQEFTIPWGFGTPTGREFLLGKIGDEREPMKRRVRYAEMLEVAGEDYNSSSFSETEPGSLKPSPAPVKGNGSYITRIARLAFDNQGHEELCLELLACLDLFEKGLGNPEINKDRVEALSVLNELRKSTTSERIRERLKGMPAGTGLR